VMVPSADPHRRVFMCVDCVDNHWTNIVVARKPSSSHRYPLSGRALDLADDETECSVCEKVFNFWRRPHSCSECESDVCVACSDGDVSSQILNISRARVCKPCMPGIKTRIEERKAENPRLESDAKRELLLIDKSIEMEPVDEGETITAAEWRDKSKAVAAGASVVVGSPRRTSKEENCSVCHKSYGVFRKKKSCNNCESAVCASCSHEFKMPSLGWTEQRRICDPCLPLISAQLDKVNSSVASKKQLQKDRHSVMQLMGGGDANTATAVAPINEDSDEEPGSAAVAPKSRPKVAPLNLSQTTGSSAVAMLLSPRYTGPLTEPDPLNPAKTLDWSVLLGKDIHKESQKMVDKKKLAEIARVREVLLQAQRKYTAELSNIENREMKATAEEQKQWLTLRLVEAQGMSSHGKSFFLSVGNTIAASSAWSAPFAVPFAKQLLVRLLSEQGQREVGSVSISVDRIQPEDLDRGTTLSLVLEGGVVQISIKTGKGLK
jgi:hypothetical protein